MNSVEIASLIVALLAFIISIWQGILTRTHFQVSVRPTITSTFTALMSAERIGYLITNQGLGPATINKVFYFYNDNKVGTSEKNIEWMKAYFSNINHPNLTCFALNEGNVVSAGADVWLVYVDNARSLSAKQRNDLAGKLAKVSIIVHYESVYGERFQHLVQGEVAVRSLTESKSRKDPAPV